MKELHHHELILQNITNGKSAGNDTNIFANLTDLIFVFKRIGVLMKKYNSNGFRRLTLA